MSQPVSNLPSHPAPQSGTDSRFVGQLKRWGRSVVDCLAGMRQETVATSPTVAVSWDGSVFTATIRYRVTGADVDGTRAGEGFTVWTFNPPAVTGTLTIGFARGVLSLSNVGKALPVWQSADVTGADSATTARQITPYNMVTDQLTRLSLTVGGGAEILYQAGPETLHWRSVDQYHPYLAVLGTTAYYYDGQAQWQATLTDDADSWLWIGGLYSDSSYPDVFGVRFERTATDALPAGWEWGRKVGRVTLASGLPTVLWDGSRAIHHETIGMDTTVAVKAPDDSTVWLRFLNGNLIGQWDSTSYTTTTTTNGGDWTTSSTTTTTTTPATTTTTTTTTAGLADGYYCVWLQLFRPGSDFTESITGVVWDRCLWLTGAEAAQYPLRVESPYLEGQYTLNPGSPVANCDLCPSASTTTTTTTTTAPPVTTTTAGTTTTTTTTTAGGETYGYYCMQRDFFDSGDCSGEPWNNQYVNYYMSATEAAAYPRCVVFSTYTMYVSILSGPHEGAPICPP